MSSIQWNLSFGTPPCRGYKIWSNKNVHHDNLCTVTFIKGTPLFRGRGPFSRSQNPGLTSILRTP